MNKLALIGRFPFDCGSSCGDCFFASMGHGLYSNADLHFHIRNAGITHMINNPELYIESLANVSWDHYIHEMSKQETWCDNVIIQAVANALSCIIHTMAYLFMQSGNPGSKLIILIISETIKPLKFVCN